MQVPHNAVVLVADGRKMLFFRNEGQGDQVKLTVEHAEEQVNPADRDQKTDAAGQSSSTHMGTMGEVDFHQQEEDRFAAQAADMLRKRALANGFEALIIVAPPKTLGEMRKHYHKEVEKRLTAELPKDLTGHPVAEIEAALKNA